MVDVVISKEDAEQYDKFVNTVLTLHNETFKESRVEQKIMALYIGAVNMIGNIYQQSSAKDKRVMLRSFIADVRNNFRKKKCWNSSAE